MWQFSNWGYNSGTLKWRVCLASHLFLSLGTVDVSDVWYMTCWCSAWYLMHASPCQLALVIS